MGERRGDVVALGAIVGGAFAGRVIYVLAVTRHKALMLDEFYYASVASRVADGKGFTSRGFYYGAPGSPLADHPPLTSVVLAPWVRLAGYGHFGLARCAMAALGALTVLLVGLVGREVAGRRVGLIAAGIAAVYPNLWVNDGLLMSETVAALATALTLWLAYRLRRSPSVGMAILAGAAAALAGLARVELVLLLPLLVLPVVLSRRDQSGPDRLRMAGAATAAGLLTLVPWVAYNLQRFERPVLLSADGGTLLGANCDDTYYGPRLGFWNGLCALPPPGSGGDASVHSERMRRTALEYIGDHKGRLPVVVAARLGRTWGVFRPFDPVEWNAFDGRPRWISLAQVWLFWLVAGFAIAGTVLLRRRGQPVWLLLAPVLAVTVATITVYGRERFRVPAEVPLVVFAAVAVDQLVGRLMVRRSRSLGRQVPVEPAPES